MSALREKTIEMVRQLPDEKISYVFNMLHNLEPVIEWERKESEAALERLMQYRGTLPDDFDYKAELAEARTEKYENIG